jgi:predicted dehydrogenase
VGGFGDLGVHLLDLLCSVTGEMPEEVLGARMVPRPTDSAVERDGMALLGFPSGWCASVSAGWTDPVMRSCLELAGTEGAVRIVDGALVEAAGGMSAADFPAACAPAASTAYERFFDAVTGSEVELVDPADAAMHCRLLEGIYAR